MKSIYSKGEETKGTIPVEGSTECVFRKQIFKVDPPHSKQYVVEVHKVGSSYLIYAAYGRIGNSPVITYKGMGTAENTSKARAMNIIEKKIRERGYSREITIE